MKNRSSDKRLKNLTEGGSGIHHWTVTICVNSAVRFQNDSANFSLPENILLSVKFSFISYHKAPTCTSYNVSLITFLSSSSKNKKIRELIKIFGEAAI